MTEMEFGRMFMAFGAVENVKLIRDPQTNYSLGYGFVKFVEQEDAEKAVEAMNGLRIGNKDIKVNSVKKIKLIILPINYYKKVYFHSECFFCRCLLQGPAVQISRMLICT